MKLSEAKIGDKVWVYLTEATHPDGFGYLSEVKTKVKVKAIVIATSNLPLDGYFQRCIAFDAESGMAPNAVPKIDAISEQSSCVYISDIPTIKKNFAYYTWTMKDFDCLPISGASCQDGTKVPCKNKWCNWKPMSTDTQCSWCGTQL